MGEIKLQSAETDLRLHDTKILLHIFIFLIIYIFHNKPCDNFAYNP